MGNLFDLLKYYAFEGGIAGIVIGAFLLFGIYLLYKTPRKTALIVVFMILFFILSVSALIGGLYGVGNWKSITANRVKEKHWAVQLQTDDTIQDAQKNKKLFQPEFNDLVIVLMKDKDDNNPRYKLFNLYFTDLEADSGKDLAHRKWQKFGYGEPYKDSASTKNLGELCKNFQLSEDGNYYICLND